MVYSEKVHAYGTMYSHFPDDRQSIYSFRGANVENILRFTEWFPDAKTYNLERNYRSQQIIVDASECVILKNTDQLKKTSRSMNPPGQRISLYSAVDDDDEAIYIADQVEDLINVQNMDYPDVAILYRIGAVSRLIEQALMRRKIPYIIVGGMHFYGRREVRDVLAMLRAAINPTDDGAILRLTNLLSGIGQSSIDAWMQYASDNSCSLLDAFRDCKIRNSKARAQAQRLIAWVEDWQSAVMTLPLDRFLLYVVSKFEYYTHLESKADTLEDSIQRKNNVEELIRAGAEIQETEPGSLSAAKLLDMAAQADGEQKHDGVRLMTIHASKGLEFPVVFVAAMNDGILPMNVSNKSEERRLAYVAMTRAMKKLYLTHAATRFHRGSQSNLAPSPFIDDIPAEFIKLEF